MDDVEAFALRLAARGVPYRKALEVARPVCDFERAMREIEEAASRPVDIAELLEQLAPEEW